MPIDIETTQSPTSNNTAAERHAYRFHAPHLHLQSVFGDDWFALKAEAFARFFGTPSFLITQTAIVAIWILLNVLGLTTFDIYPFILLNLAFSLQAAYAAPLILLAQTRQADRDAAHARADAEHREALHTASVTTITIAEGLTGPLQAADDALARRYRAIRESWQPIALGVDIAEGAARLRASLRLKLTDAVQAASALAINAAALVTHDRDFSRVHSLRIIS